MAELNESAIEAIEAEDIEDGLECLKKAEELILIKSVSPSLNSQKSPGKWEIDRAYIVIIYYNLACCY
jgi:hypothetical protein